MESKCLPPRENGTILGEPLHVDRFLHVSGLSVRFFEEVILWTGLEIRGILVANATMFCHLLPGFSCGSKHLLLP